VSPITSLLAQPWWTEADQAELVVMSHELVETVWTHREACETCLAGYPPCPKVAAALEVVIDWRARRTLASKAAWLRRLQDAQDGLQEAA
jgi:hypothetical protein